MPQDHIKDYTGGLMGGTPTPSPTPSPGVKDYTGGLISTDPSTSSTSTESPGIMGNVLTTVAPVLDVLSRGQYASAGFFDALINDDSSIGDALSLAGSELISPTKRRSFEDVIQRANPDFAANSPKATKMLGFLLDIGLDPTTYVGIGLGSKGAKIGGRALTRVGEELQLTARKALGEVPEFAIGLNQIPGRRLLPGGSRNIEIPHGGQLDKARILAKESLTRLPRELAEKVNLKKAAGAAYAIDPIVPEANKTISVIRKVFGKNLPKDATNSGLLDLATRISLERLGVQDVTEAVMFLRRPLSEVEIVDSADRLISRLASEFPTLDREVFKPKGIYGHLGIPFTPLQKEVPLVTTNMLRAVGLDRLSSFVDLVAKLPSLNRR